MDGGVMGFVSQLPLDNCFDLFRGECFFIEERLDDKKFA